MNQALPNASIPDFSALADQILGRLKNQPTPGSWLVAISGIDGSGKGFMTGHLVQCLQARGSNAVAIHADGWLNLPEIRFDPERPAERFYEAAFRFDEMFARLVLPLKAARSIVLDADFVEETATAYRPFRYDFQDVDVIVLEGAYLFQPAYRRYYDVAVWVDCSFETAMERALDRCQEGLPPAETIHAYETIYFPAERIHFERDDPRGSADLVVINDPRLNV